tara:strand:- start:12138 stop:12314 length:177 start_codon:yes stop_codon:yes gene_type:complete
MRVFATPFVIALATIGGLIAALIGDGWLDWVAWAGLSTAVVIPLRCGIRARRGIPPGR